MTAHAIRALTSALTLWLAAGCSADTAPANPNAGGEGGSLAGQPAKGGSAGAALGGKSGSGAGGEGVGGGPPGGQSGGGAGGTDATGAEGGAVTAGTAGSSAGFSAAGSGGSAGSGGVAGSGNASNRGGTGGTPGGTGGQAGASGQGGAGEGGEITIWIAGDSTVANANACPIGWGGVFAERFDERVTVVNRAVGGRSVRTWMYNVGTSMDASGECVLATDANGTPTLQARWQEMLDGMRRGDYLFIQFGINDGSATCDRHVGIEAFKDTYGVLAEAAKARGAQPVFVTPVSAIACNGSTARGTRGDFVPATAEAGDEFDVPVIDLHQLSVDLYDESGFCPIPGGSDVSASTGGEVGAFFCDDHTHFDRPGAERIAELVATALTTQSLGLASYLK